MPCRYHFAGQRILVCVFEGLYTLEETLAVFKAGLDDPEAAVGVSVIIDITHSEADKSPEDFGRVVQELRRHTNFTGRIAAVPRGDDPLRYGLARQFAALTSLDGVPMKVCLSISDAVNWLMRVDAPAIYENGPVLPKNGPVPGESASD